MNETRKCIVCNEVKPLEDFPIKKGTVQENRCKACKAAAERKRREGQSQEERNAIQAAFRAGMRKDKCAVCGDAIEGHGICKPCTTAINLLGGTPEDLKRAARALKWLQEQ